MSRLIDILNGRDRGVAIAQKGIVSTTDTFVPGNGYNGLFSYPGMEKPVVSTLQMPLSGLIDVLPSRMSQATNPVYGIITGQTAGTGSNRATPCGDPPTPGDTKLCKRMLPFGIYSLASKVIDIRDAGVFRNRGEFNDFEFYGPSLGNMSGGAMEGANASNPLRGVVEKAIYELAVDWKRRYTEQIWLGNVSNNNAGGGYREFYGLDYQVNTGYRDIETGTACAAADSLVRSFGSLDVASNGGTLVREVGAIINALEVIARNAQLDAGFELALVMRSPLWWEVTEVWACNYFLQSCAGSSLQSGVANNIDATRTTEFRDAMRTGNYLLVNGKRYPVIVDDTLTETALAGSSYTSTIYFLPMRYAGGRPGVYLEYRDFTEAVTTARAFADGTAYYTTNGGRYLWHKRPSSNGCVQLQVEAEYRLILEVPFLAGRLDSVKYTPRIHTREWDPDYSFYVNGGQTVRTGDSSLFPFIGPRA